MISYSWKQKTTARKICQYLKERGIRVWSDDRQMVGNIYDSMRKGIEGSKVFLLCMSKEYDESANCCRERDWAADLNKPIIPLVMEDYDMKSSLSRFISAGALYYQFFSESTQPIEGEVFETTMASVLQDIKEKLKRGRLLFLLVSSFVRTDLKFFI